MHGDDGDEGVSHRASGPGDPTEDPLDPRHDRRGKRYIRTTRPNTPVLYGPDERFAIGGLKVLRESPEDRATVVGAGITLHEALGAWEALRQRGVPVRVINLYSIEPIDRAGLVTAARATGGWLITVEDHYAGGGLGDAVLEAVSPEGIRVRKLAVTELPRSGRPSELLDRHGISARRIVDAVLETTGEGHA